MFSQLMLQTNHAAVSQAVKGVPVSLCLKRSFHFARDGLSGRRLAFHHRSPVLGSRSFNIAGSYSAVRWSSSETGESIQQGTSVC